MFPGGPRRGNDVNPGMPLMIYERSYGPLKSLKVLGESMLPSLQSRQRAAATQGGSRSVMTNCAGIQPKYLGIPCVSWWCPTFGNMRDRPARKNRNQAFYRGISGNLIASHLICPLFPLHISFMFPSYSLCISFVIPVCSLCTSFIFPL